MGGPTPCYWGHMLVRSLLLTLHVVCLIFLTQARPVKAQPAKAQSSHAQLLRAARGCPSTGSTGKAREDVLVHCKLANSFETAVCKIAQVNLVLAASAEQKGACESSARTAGNIDAILFPKRPTATITTEGCTAVLANPAPSEVLYPYAAARFRADSPAAPVASLDTVRKTCTSKLISAGLPAGLVPPVLANPFAACLVPPIAAVCAGAAKAAADAAAVGIAVLVGTLSAVLIKVAADRAKDAAKDKAVPDPQVEECKAIHKSYDDLDNPKKCLRTDDPATRASKIALATRVLIARELYLFKRCDYILEGRKARGSEAAERGHEQQVKQLESLLQTCRSLPMGAAK